MNEGLIQLGTDLATTSVAIVSSAITNFWPYILGVIVVVGLAYRFKRLIGVAR